MMEKRIIHGSYGSLLFNPKWREKRQHIIDRDGGRCVICGSTDELIVHHKQYHLAETGEKYVPWNYPDKYLVTLCKDCHQRGHAKYNVPAFVIKNH